MSYQDKKNANWEKKLKQKGYRLTQPRKIILESLSRYEEPRTAENIYLMIQKQDSSIGLATVYRTLELLVELNLVAKISFGSDKSFYIFADTNTQNIPNYLICKKCGRIITNNKCLDNAIKIRLIEDAEKNIFKNCGIRIEGYQIFFAGLCDKCV